MRIMLATPCSGGKAEYEYTLSLLTQTFLHPERLLQQEKYNIGLELVGGSSGLAKDRGVIASHALHLGYDKLMLIDSDQAWTWEQLKAILDSDKPIVCGVVALKQYPILLNFTPNVADKDCFAEETGKVTPKGLARLREKHGADEIPVQCAGTGFMCIDVSVLKELAKTCPEFYHPDKFTDKKPHDFFMTGVVNGIYMGEDWAHCAMAKRSGFQTYINSSVHIDHIGRHTYKIGQEIASGA